MTGKESGLTLIELMITMLLSVLVIAAATSVFINLYSQARVQVGIVESHESVIGFDVLKRDIESAGYGLAWDGLISYSESALNPFGLNDAPTGAPRAIVSQNNVTTYSAPNDLFNGSDYLVIKSVNVARNDAGEKCTYVRQNNIVREWTPASANFSNGDRVIVLSPRDKTTRPLVLNSAGTGFYTTYINVAGADSLADGAFAPLEENDTYMVYGINSPPEGAPVRPFNRADYYIATAADMPSRCAPNTGVLIKATMNHNAAGTFATQALIDCVADMQVIYGLDEDEDGDFEPGAAGSTDAYSDALDGLTAQQIRTRVKQVRVYILTHEGSRDRNFNFGSSTKTVGEFGLGRTVSLGTNRNYRWKVYQLTVTPLNLIYGE